MSSVKIPIEATFAAGTVEAELDKLTQKINQLGTSFAKVSGEQWNPISKVAVDDIKKMTDQFERLKKNAPSVANALHAAGQGKADYFDVDWDKVFTSAITRSATRYGAFRKTIEGIGDGGFSPIRPNSTPGGSGSGGGNGGGKGNGGDRPAGGGNTPGTTWGSAGRKILGSGLRSLGAGGAAAAGAMEGMAGGLAGPMILANLVAQGVSAVAGAVKAKIGDAQQLDIGYDTLKRQTGDVGVGFERLKVSLQDASWGFSATYEETQAVASAFAKAAGTFGKATEHLAGEAAIAGGFARSFGIDTARSAQFFGAMRANGATTDEAGSKRLALMVGEAVAKSGSSAKMDDVLEAIASFTQSQTRFGMASANTAGWLSEFSGLAGSHTPGTDPQAIAALLSSVNSAIQHGGNAGEAGQNFIYRALGSRNGLDPIQTQILQEQGLAGTMGGTFGAGSEWETFAKKYHVRSPSLGASSGQMNFTSIMDSLKQNYASNPELMLSAMKNLFGISMNQAMKLADTDPVSVNGTASRLSRLKLDLSKVNATGIERLTHIESDKSLSSDEKDRQFRNTYDKNQETTDGTRVRDAVSGVQKAVTDMADKMVPLTTSIMNSVVYLAGDSGKKSQRQIDEAVNKADHADRISQIQDAAAQARKAKQPAIDWLQSREGQQLKRDTENPLLTQAQRDAAKKEWARRQAEASTSDITDQETKDTATENARFNAQQSEVQQQSNAMASQQLLKYNFDAIHARNKSPGSTSSPEFLASLDAGDKELGYESGTMQAIMNKESGGKAGAIGYNKNGTIDVGAFQQNSKFADAFAERFKAKFKRDPDLEDPNDAREIAKMHLADDMIWAKKNARKGATLSDIQRLAIQHYHGSDDGYADSILGSIQGRPVPKDDSTQAAADKAKRGGDNGKHSFQFEHNIQITLPNGQPAGSLRAVSTAGPSGNPYGTN